MYVLTRITRTLNLLTVGHTHEDIDQIFGFICALIEGVWASTAPTGETAVGPAMGPSSAPRGHQARNPTGETEVGPAMKLMNSTGGTEVGPPKKWAQQ